MSLNDPQWGKRGGNSGGPPDLDEIWRNVNRRLSGLLGRRGGLIGVGREDLLLGLAVEQGDELLGLDRLPLQQDL